MELELRVKGVYFNRPSHRSNIHDCLNPPNDNAEVKGLSTRSTLHIKLECRFPFDLCQNPRSEIEDTGEACDNAVLDHVTTRDEDGVEKVEGDFAVGCEPLEFGEGARVVGGDGGG